ncbi:hypothetical protein GWI33_019283 [Rhynchophorus ferrugineus]|uniref:Uncharacterized protein n=1 Tax=Rhynchophorus ferrugineus TaxID=354439 RepID=A0A834M5G3_RHYFE|nr:hypothetical protein GWI33_019283 [Rhynchophorus ferrugineus]
MASEGNECATQSVVSDRPRGGNKRRMMGSEVDWGKENRYPKGSMVLRKDSFKIRRTKNRLVQKVYTKNTPIEIFLSTLDIFSPFKLFITCG